MILNMVNDICAESIESERVDGIRGWDNIEIDIQDRKYTFGVRKLESQYAILVPEKMQKQAELAVMFAAINPAPKTYVTPGLKREVHLNEIPGWIIECIEEGGRGYESIVYTNPQD